VCLCTAYEARWHQVVGAATLHLANVFLAGRRNGEAMDTAARGADVLPPRAGARQEEVATFGALLLTAAVAAAGR